MMAPMIPVVNVMSFLNVVVSTISPGTWTQNGGQVGRIQPLGTMLVVTHQNSVHNEIRSLISDIRRNASPNSPVNIRATWVQTDARQLLTPTFDVNEEWMAKQKVYCETQITCFSGQTVHYVSGSSKTYVADLTPIVGTNAVAFDPTISPAPTGVKMQVTPQLFYGAVGQGDTQLVVVDIRSEVSESTVQSPMAQIMSIGAPGEGNAKEIGTASVDRVTLLRQEFQTTTRLPIKKKVIVGGMTLEPSGNDQGKQLYLIVEVDVIKP